MLNIGSIEDAVRMGVTIEDYAKLLGRELTDLEVAQFEKTALDYSKHAITKQTYTVQKTKTPPIHKRYTKTEFSELVWQCHGLETALANKCDCTVNQIRWAIKHWKLENEVEEARQTLANYAEDTIMGLLQKSTDERVRLDAAKFILKTLGRQRGWMETPQNAIQINADSVSINDIFGIDNEKDKAD